MDAILDGEVPRARLTVLLKHFSQIADGLARLIRIRMYLLHRNHPPDGRSAIACQ